MIFFNTDFKYLIYFTYYQHFYHINSISGIYEFFHHFPAMRLANLKISLLELL